MNINTISANLQTGCIVLGEDISGSEIHLPATLCKLYYDVAEDTSSIYYGDTRFVIDYGAVTTPVVANNSALYSALQTIFGEASSLYYGAVGVAQYLSELVDAMPQNTQTFYASVLGLASASAGCTDLFSIYGRTNGIIKVKKLLISARMGTSTACDLQVVKRSTANSGGTSSTITQVGAKSSYAVGNETIKAYTANPASLGTSAGLVGAQRVLIPGASIIQGDNNFDFGDGIYLLSDSQGLCLNLNNSALTSSSFALTWVYDIVS